MIGWPFDPSVYLGLLGLYLGWAWLARGRDQSRIHALYFGMGLATLWLALETPIDTISDRYLDSIPERSSPNSATLLATFSSSGSTG